MKYAELSEEERTRLRAAFDAGFSTGSGSAWLLPADPQLGALMDAVTDDWFVSREIAQAQRHILPGHIPEWLRATAERHNALGDAQPPTGITAPIGGGR